MVNFIADSSFQLHGRCSAQNIINQNYFLLPLFYIFFSLTRQAGFKSYSIFTLFFIHQFFIFNSSNLPEKTAGLSHFFRS